MSAELDDQAAEYVLGTLSAEERDAFETLLKSDVLARRAVAAWQQRLAPLHTAVGDVEPPAHIWPSIERALPAAASDTARLISLRRSRNRWRIGAMISGAIAAGLAAFSIDRTLVSSNDQEGSYVAAINRGGDQPALIVRVDLAKRMVYVRPVATNIPAGHSLELWYIGHNMPPRSMGLVDKRGRRMPLPEGAKLEDANFAVSVEPEGGSPTGAPTGPVVYSGQLFKE